MPPDETLSAVIKAKDEVSATLQSLAEGFEEVAEEATKTAAATEAAAEGIDAAGDEASEATGEMLGLKAAMAGLEGARIDVDADVLGADEALGSIQEMSEATTDLDASKAVAETEASTEGIRESVREIRRAQASIPDLDTKINIDEEVSSWPDFYDLRDTLDDVARGRQSTLGDPLGDRETGFRDGAQEERIARRYVTQLDAGTTDLDETVEEVQTDLTEFGKSRYTTMLAADNRESNRVIDDSQQALNEFANSTGTAHLRAEGLDDVDQRTKAIGRALRRLDAEEAESEHDVDGAQESIGELTLIDRLLGRVDGREAESEVDVDTKDSKRNLSGLRGTFNELAEDIGGATFSTELGERFDSRGDSRVDMAGILEEVNRAVGVDSPDASSLRSELDSIKQEFSGLPPMRMDIENEEDVRQFAGSLQQAQKATSDVSQTISDIDDDELIRSASSADDLRRTLSRMNRNTDQAERSLESLEGASRDFADDLIASSRTVNEFERQTEQMGDKAVRAAAKLQTAEGQVNDITVSAAIAAKSTDDFTDEIDDMGDEAVGTAAQLRIMNQAMRDAGPNIGDVSTRMLGMKTSLVTVARLTPMILSLTSAIGGLATAAIGAGGALTAMFAGGLLAAGGEVGNELAAANMGVEDLEGNAKDAVEAESELGRTMAGVAEIMERVKQAAFEAMEPLRTSEMAEFTLRGIEGALTVLHEFAQAIASMDQLFLDFGNNIADVWWAEFPAIAEAAANATRDLLPILERLVTGAIRALPGLFDSMAQQGQDILPLLGDFISALIDALPSILRLGTAMLTIAIPAIEGIAMGLEWLAPVTETVADVLQYLGTALRGPIKWLSALVTVVYAASTAWGTLGIVKGGLMAIFGGMLGHLAGFASLLSKALGPLIAVARGVMFLLGGVSALATGVGLVVALAAIITYFDLWDEVLVALAKSWNWFVGLVAKGGGIVEDAIESLLNMAIDGLNELIKQLNRLPLVNIDPLENVDLDAMDAWEERHTISEDSARGVGETMNMRKRGNEGFFQRLSGGVASFGADVLTGGDGMRPTPDQTPDRGRGQGRGGGRGRGGRSGRGGETWTEIDTIHVDSSPETNDAEIKKAVREAVNEADTEQRRRGSSLN